MRETGHKYICFILLLVLFSFIPGCFSTKSESDIMVMKRKIAAVEAEIQDIKYKLPRIKEVKEGNRELEEKIEATKKELEKLRLELKKSS